MKINAGPDGFFESRTPISISLSSTSASGCSTGSDQVDVNNGGEFRFVAATPAGEVIPDGERSSAPEFSGTLLDGESWSSQDLDGDVAVINFWGSWCAPCRAEIADLQKVYEATADSGVVFLGINVRDDLDKAKAFQRGRVTYPSLFDAGGQVTLAFKHCAPGRG